MILPLYVCATCGKFGGVALSFSQSFAKLAAGEKCERDSPIIVECPDGHGPMRLVGENDRLRIVPSPENGATNATSD